MSYLCNKRGYDDCDNDEYPIETNTLLFDINVKTFMNVTYLFNPLILPDAY